MPGPNIQAWLDSWAAADQAADDAALAAALAADAAADAIVLAGKDSQITSLTNQVATLTAQVSNLTTQVTNLTAQVSTLTTSNTSLTTQVNTLTSANTALTASNNSLTSQVATLTSANATLTSANTALTAQVTTLTTANATLTAQVTQLQADLAACLAADAASVGPKVTVAPAGATVLTPTTSNIAGLIAAAPTGATFYFNPGIYRNLSLAPKDGQIFLGAQGAILNGSSVLTGWTQSGSTWWVGGQTQQGPVHTGAQFIAGTQRPGYPETVFIDNVPLKPVDALSKVVTGTFYFDYVADKIYIFDNPAGHTIEAGKLTDAFHGTASNVTVQNLVVEKYDPMIQNGAISAGTGWIIKDNELRLNYSCGVIARGNNAQILSNYIHDNGQMGTGGSGNTILVQGNELARNGFWSFIDPLWEAGGFKFSNTDGLTVRGNYAHDNAGTGMWTDINNIRTLYEDNVASRNTINGVSHEISYDCTIRNNTFWGNGFGDSRGWGWGADICNQNSLNVEIYGNKVESTGGGNGGIMMIQQNRGSGTFGTYQVTGCKVHDNIFIDHDTKGLVGGLADFNASVMTGGGNTWTNNQYYMADASRFRWVSAAQTFAQFKTATGETGAISQTYPDTSTWKVGL